MSSRKTRHAVIAIVLVSALVYIGNAFAAPATRPEPAKYFDMFVACWHDEASEYHCGGGGDSSSSTMYYEASQDARSQKTPVRFASNPATSPTRASAGRSFPSDSVNTVILTVYMRDGTVRSKAFTRQVDAIFLSRASTQNMLHRYYLTQAVDTTLSARLREQAAVKAKRLMARLDTVWPPKRAP
jgi:hypothetical protein